jgi:hypothetical protein
LTKLKYDFNLVNKIILIFCQENFTLSGSIHKKGFSCRARLTDLQGISAWMSPIPHGKRFHPQWIYGKIYDQMKTISMIMGKRKPPV